MNHTKFKKWRRVPLIIWIFLMLFLSSRPGVVSAQSSKPFEESFSVVQEKIRSSETLKINLNGLLKSPRYLVRKAAHVFLYGGLFVWSTLAFIKSKNRFRTYLLLFVCCVLYACFDEVFQTFIPGRSGQAPDVLVDSIGVTLGALMSVTCIEVGVRRSKRLIILLSA